MSAISVQTRSISAAVSDMNWSFKLWGERRDLKPVPRSLALSFCRPYTGRRTRRREHRAASPTGHMFSARDRADRAFQCADKPENNQDDENQAEYAAQPRRSVATMGVVAASAAQQDNQQYNQQNRSHDRSPLSSRPRSSGDGCLFLDLFRDHSEAR